MYEIDFLPIGDGARSGDAIAMRFTRPDSDALAHVIIDGGFQDDGQAIVNHVNHYYGVDAIDLVICTHPDGDHIGGLGTVIEKLDVASLAVHDLGARGGSDLKAAKAVGELRDLAKAEGTALYEPFSGLNAFGEALLVAGPNETDYQQLVAEQVAEERAGTRTATPSRSLLAEAASRLSARVVGAFPLEIPFSDAGGTNPRNNSSAIVDLRLGEKRFVFTGDAGVPALDSALAYLEDRGRTDVWPRFVHVPHHGSRHNATSELLNRTLGGASGQNKGSAYISISREAAKDPRYPSPRVANAYGRRGYSVCTTAGTSICFSGDGAPDRGWTPITPLPPLDESIDDRD